MPNAIRVKVIAAHAVRQKNNNRKVKVIIVKEETRHPAKEWGVPSTDLSGEIQTGIVVPESLNHVALMGVVSTETVSSTEETVNLVIPRGAILIGISNPVTLKDVDSIETVNHVISRDEIMIGISSPTILRDAVSTEIVSPVSSEEVTLTGILNHVISNPVIQKDAVSTETVNLTMIANPASSEEVIPTLADLDSIVAIIVMIIAAQVSNPE